MPGPGLPVDENHWMPKREGSDVWGPVPQFHRDLNAIVEHCGPQMKEWGWRWQIWEDSTGHFVGYVTGLSEQQLMRFDTPALALASAIHAVMVAREAKLQTFTEATGGHPDDEP